MFTSVGTSVECHEISAVNRVTLRCLVAAACTVRAHREFVDLRSGDEFDVSTQSCPLVLLLTLNSDAPQWYQQVVFHGMRSLARHFCWCPCVSRLYIGEIRSMKSHVVHVLFG